MNLDDVLTVLAELEGTGVRYAVFGGLAMAAHGFDRGTGRVIARSVSASREDARQVAA